MSGEKHALFLIIVMRGRHIDRTGGGRKGDKWNLKYVEHFRKSKEKKEGSDRDCLGARSRSLAKGEVDICREKKRIGSSLYGGDGVYFVCEKRGLTRPPERGKKRRDS